MVRAHGWILLGLLAAAGSSCRRGVAPGASGTEAGGNEVTAPVAEGAPAATDGVAGDEASASAARPTSFVWTSAPKPADVPAAPVVGEVHGAPFEVAQVLFEPTWRGWSVVLLEHPLPDPAAPVSGMRFLRVDLPAEPAVGVVQERALAYGGSMFQVEIPEEPGSLTMWTADNAWVLEVTEWEVRPWDPAGPAVQSAGRAAGRIAVCYQGAGSFRNAWVAGTFDGALVRYPREPRFDPECSPAPQEIHPLGW